MTSWDTCWHCRGPDATGRGTGYSPTRWGPEEPPCSSVNSAELPQTQITATFTRVSTVTIPPWCTRSSLGLPPSAPEPRAFPSPSRWMAQLQEGDS